MTLIPSSIHDLPAIPVPRRPSKCSNAWKDEYKTVALTHAIQAIRVHVGAGTAASQHRHLATGAGLHGSWFAIGDVVQTYEQYRASRALPSHFTNIAIATLAAGSVVNVGLCSPLFGLPGEGEQLEFVEGPPPVFRELDATWSHVAGHA